MNAEIKYYIVAAEALPEVFLKVAEAKRLLSVGEAATVNEATQITGISRSAFYKYRDAVLPFQNMMTGRIITFQLLLHDTPGILSNILTINQSIPVNGCAAVTISAETSEMQESLEALIAEVSGTYGVVKFEILAGERYIRGRRKEKKPRSYQNEWGLIFTKDRKTFSGKNRLMI